MELRFKIFKGVNGQYYFRLRAPNGQIICQCEGYKNKSDCEYAISKIKEYAHKASVVYLQNY